MKEALYNGKIIEATDFVGNINHSKFYCPQCHTEVSYNRGGEHRIAHFKTKPSKPHKPLCDYYYNGGGNVEYTLHEFNTIDALNYLVNFKPSGSSRKPRNTTISLNERQVTKPRKLKSIFKCLFDNIHGSFNESNVDDILCCEETRYNHHILNGPLVVKAKWGWNTNSVYTSGFEMFSLGLFYPCLYNENQIRIKVKFKNSNDFYTMFNLGKNNKQYAFLIFADFTNNECIIENISQITILK